MEKRIKYELKDKLTTKGFPYQEPGYRTAHEEASKAEKKKFGKKSYNKLKKMDEEFPVGELIGKNLKSGKIEVSRKVPKPLRQEVAYHETVENKILLKKAAKKKKK